MSTQPVTHAERQRRLELRRRLASYVELQLRPRVNEAMRGRYQGVCNAYHQKSPAEYGGHLDLHFFKLRTQLMVRGLELLAPIIPYADALGVDMSVRQMDTSTREPLNPLMVEPTRASNLIVSFRMKGAPK